MEASVNKRGSDPVVIIGAGPAGLTAAYHLCKLGRTSLVLEKDLVVGGISRTVNFKDNLFDVGGHRFFTKIDAARDMWHEVLREDLLHRKRLSRIYYNKRFFFYPIRPMNALQGLGLWNSALIIMSYLHAHLFPHKKEDTFEQWVTNRFGRRLYSIFFKTYTEKVWGMPCSEIRAEWAAQRIKGLSLLSTLKNALFRNQGSSKRRAVKTLIDSFEYPRLGPGMMWQTVSRIVRDRGSRVDLGSEVRKVFWDRREQRVTAVEVMSREGSKVISGSEFISSMPLRELIQKLSPAAPQEVLSAAGNLSYRDFLTVALVINRPDLFPDNWIYIHDPLVRLGRVQNFKNWSPDMVADPMKSCIGLEYFCSEGDDIWSMDDGELIELGKKELGTIGLADPADVEEGCVVRMPKAYPAYDSRYREMLGILRNFLAGFGNLHLVGRNGLHRYNNQDHSMYTAMLAVENIHGARHDLWSVNDEQEYHEFCETR